MLYPAAGAPSCGIVVSPVNHAPFRIPFVFTPHPDRLAGRDVFHSRGEVDIVGDQDGMAGRELDNEPLVSWLLSVITQNTFDPSVDGDKEIAAFFGKCLFDDAGASRFGLRNSGVGARLLASGRGSELLDNIDCRDERNRDIDGFQ